MGAGCTTNKPAENNKGDTSIMGAAGEGRHSGAPEQGRFEKSGTQKEAGLLCSWTVLTKAERRDAKTEAGRSFWRMLVE